MNNRALRIVEARGVGLCHSCGRETPTGKYCPNCQFELDELEALGRLEARNHYAIQPRRDGLTEALYDHQAWEDNDAEYAARAGKPARRLAWSNWIYLAGAIAIELWLVVEFVHAAWKKGN